MSPAIRFTSPSPYTVGPLEAADIPDGPASPKPIEPTRQTPARNFATRSIRDVSYYMNYGEYSIPGITNLVFSVINIVIAIAFIVRGCCGSGELIRDGVLKLTASIVTLSHAIITLGLILAPYIENIKDVIKSCGPDLMRLINIAGIVISAIEIIVIGWHLVRQTLFDRHFEYRDILGVESDLSEKKLQEQMAAWIQVLRKNQSTIDKLFKQPGKAQKLIQEIEGCQHSRETTQTLLERAKALQNRFKTEYLNQNFIHLHRHYFDMSSEQDQCYIASFGPTEEAQERGINALSEHKLLRAYRRMPCKALATEVNRFVITNAQRDRDHIVTEDNVEQASRLFKEIQQKSRQVKIINMIAMVGLLSIAAGFIAVTAGIGAPAIFPILFWGGWGIAFGASIGNACWVHTKGNKVELSRMLPDFIRKRIWKEPEQSEYMPPTLTYRMQRLRQPLRRQLTSLHS